MGLRIVYGRAGSGKSTYCLNEIRNRLKENEGPNSAWYPLVLIVPEQFSLQTEKSLAEISDASDIFRAEVLSFRRLAFRVFGEVGGVTRRHIDAAGKSMLLFRIMDKLGSELKVFSRAAQRKGFTEVLSDAITEFKRYDITPALLKETAERLQDGLPLKDKLSDLALVYSVFEDLLHQNYLDADDDLTELYRKLDQSTQFDGAEIWIDEFSGFTPQEYKVIGKLLKKAARITICLCTDSLSSEPADGASMVFTPVRHTASRLLRLADKEGASVEAPVKLIQTVRFSGSEELSHLENNFYKYPYKKFQKYSGDVTILASANPYSEVEDCARDIIRLCRDKGYRYRDIAVTMRNPDSYSSIVKSVFTRYGIPFFLDGKREITGNPLIVFILSALEIFISNWSYESVFRYAKTGLTGIASEELDLLENYVLANGIRGNAWTRPDDWDYPVKPSDRQGEPSAEELDALNGINAVRRQLTGPLEAFRGRTKGGVKAVEFCSALFELLCQTGTDKKVEELSLVLASGGRLDKAAEFRQVWNTVMDVFTQIVEVLGDETLGTQRFSEVLNAGFDGHRMGLIPPSMDQVLAGSIERARSHDIKALYILGVNEGVLPGSKADEGLLSDIDRDSLAQAGLELAGNTTSHALEERFMVYMALATASRYLWLSYPAADREGKALRPSRVIAEVRRILPSALNKSTVTGSEAKAPEPAAVIPAFDELAAQLRRCCDGERVQDGWREIYNWFAANEDWKDRCEEIRNGLGYTNQAQRLTVDKTARLYGRPVLTSVSRLEAYTSCPFSYFIKYGLKAKERRIYRFDPVDAGTFMHHIIDEFSGLLAKNGISWRELDSDWCRGTISELVDKQLSAGGGNILASSKRYLYLSDKLKKTVFKAVMLISRHIGMSSFEPAGYEVEFGEHGRYPPITIELPDGGCIKMTGRIDRIDSMQNEDGTYLRIIDYKSGNRALKLGDVYYGLQLQLVTYLDAVLGNEAESAQSGDGPGKAAAAGRADQEALVAGRGKLLPAGILYFRLNDPLIRCGRGSSDADIEKAIMKELRMKGLVLADVKLIREMDRQLDGDSLIIPARINKDGTLGKSSAATKEQFKVLQEHVRKTLAKIGSGIVDGNVSISPYKKRTNTACTYCSFSSVCKFDTSIRENRYRILADMDEDELWQLMRKAAEDGGETAAIPAAGQEAEAVAHAENDQGGETPAGEGGLM